MAIIPQLRALLYGDVPKPKSQIVSNDESPYDFWNLKGDSRDYDHLIKLGKIYRRGGPVSEAIRTHANLVFSNGFRVEGDDEELNQEVEEALDRMGFELTGPQAVIDALVYGDAFHEIGYGQGSKAEVPVMLFPRNPESFRIEADDYGQISGYAQVIKRDLLNQEEIPLDVKRIFHLSLENLGGSVYGLSLIDSAYNDIVWDAQICEATAQAIKRHGFPRFHVKVGMEGEDVDETTMRKIDSQFKNLNSKQEFVTSHDIEISNIDQLGQTNAKLYGEWSTMRLCTALGIPEELLGLGRGSTEATANVKLRAFYDKISTIQKKVARAFTNQVIDNITRVPGKCRLVFNEVNPEDEAKLAEWIAKVMGATPIDPFAVLPRKFIQDKFGVVETEWDEDDWVDEPNGTVGPSSLDEYLKRTNEGTHEGACKAVKARGDTPGPECGGASAKPAPPKKSPNKRESRKQPKQSSVQLHPDALSAITALRRDRMKLGNPKHNYRLGAAGETIAKTVFAEYHAHDTWNDADDLCNGFLMDVKTLNPNSDGTPIFRNKILRKIERGKELGKKWKFPLLVPSEDRVDVYINTPPAEFYDESLTDYDYVARPSESSYLGWVDAAGEFHRSAKK